MRNSVLVSNTAYYTSSLKERGSSVNMLNFTQLFNDEWSSKIQGDSFVTNRHLLEHRASVCSATVMNTVRDEVYINKLGVTIHTIDSFKGDIVKEIKFAPIELKVAEPYKIIGYIAQPYEIERTYKCIASYVYNKTDFDTEYEAFVGKEFVLTKDINWVENLEGKSCNIYIKPEHIHEDIEKRHNKVSVMVKRKPLTEYTIRDEHSVVINAPKDKDAEYVSQSIIEVDVADHSVGGAATEGPNAGGDLKKLVFTIQQMSFFEFKLKFVDKKVIDVFNLPTGLIFNEAEQKIIGTPKLSGRYSISVIFDNGSSLDGIIDVPKLNREL